MKKIIFFLVILVVILSGCSEDKLPEMKINKMEENIKECNVDSDCVPETCCHSSSCVNKDNAPSCEGFLCSMDCKPNTLDCGGRCSCIEGSCEAIISRG